MSILLMALGFFRGPVRAFLAGVPREVWYAVAAVAVVIYAHHAGYRAGRVDESNAWQAKARVAAARAVQMAQRRQQAVTDAATADAVRGAATAALIAPLKQEAATHAQTAAARAPCLTGDGMRIDNGAIAAANAAIAASARRRGVPAAAADRAPRH